MAEARIRETETGRVVEGAGWFVLNLSDASWESLPGWGARCNFEAPDARFPHLGVNVHVLEPGESNALYHSEDTQEGFLVLAGECIAVIEGRERRLRQWDYFHCPPGTHHVVIGAGEGASALLMLGAPRTFTLAELDYPADATAARYGASASETTNSSKRAYAERPRNATPTPAAWPPRAEGSTTMDLERLAREFFEAYGRGDLETVRSLLSEDLTAYVTNADAGVDRVGGRDGFMSRLPDLEGAELSTSIAQIVGIDTERVIAMIEVKAERKGRTLHNFAAFLARVHDGTISELWMVDAKPAYSDEFWS